MHLLIIWFKNHCWQLIFITSAMLAIVFSFWHYFMVLDNPPTLTNIIKATISTAQLFVMGVSVTAQSTMPWQLITAITLAPFSTLGAILLTWGSRLARWLSETLLFSLKPADYIFIGGDESAAGIASRFSSSKNNNKSPKIVGLDIKNNHALPHAMRVTKSKGFMRTGDAFNDQDLEGLLLHKTKNIYITTGNDLQNIEIARRIITLIKQNKINNHINVYTHVRDHHHIRTKDALLPNINNEKVDVQFISIKRMAARAIFHKHPPALKANQPPHILIVGSSELAQCLLLHAVQHCVTHEEKNVSITWAGKNVSEKLIHLRQQFIGLGENNIDPILSKILPLANIAALDCDEDELRVIQWNNAQKTQSFDAVYIACHQDDHTMSASLRVAALREITNIQTPIIACFQQSQGSLSQGVKANEQKELPLKDNQTIHQLYGINIYNEIIQDDDINYPGEHKDYKAMIIQSVYDETIDLNDLQNTSTETDYDQLAKKIKNNWEKARKVAFNLESSRLSADHIQVKQAILDDLDIRAEEIANDAAAREKLANIEHRRFIAERLIQGWLPLPKSQEGNGVSGLNKQQQKQYLLCNKTLVPFSALDNVSDILNFEKNKDHRIVASINYIERLEQALKAIKT